MKRKTQTHTHTHISNLVVTKENFQLIIIIFMPVDFALILRCRVPKFVLISSLGYPTALPSCYAHIIYRWLSAVVSNAEEW